MSANSTLIVNTILQQMGTNGRPGNVLALQNGLNGEPVYWIPSSGNVPGEILGKYTLQCHPNGQQAATTCPGIGNTVITIPVGAVPEDGPGDPKLMYPLPSCTIYQASWTQPISAPDCHMTIADETNDTEFDLYHLSVAAVPPPPISSPPQPGVLEVESAGSLPLQSGSGIMDPSAGNANAASFGELAGRVSAEEMLANSIKHALFIGITCSNGHNVAPDPISAPGPGTCSSLHVAPVTSPPPLGTWLRLNQKILNDQVFAALPNWQQTLIHAMVTYGMFIGDTTDSRDYFDIETEGGIQYTSLKDTNGNQYGDAWLDWAHQESLPPASVSEGYDGFVAQFTKTTTPPSKTTIPWSDYLQVICYPVGSSC